MIMGPLAAESHRDIVSTHRNNDNNVILEFFLYTYSEIGCGCPILTGVASHREQAINIQTKKRILSTGRCSVSLYLAEVNSLVRLVIGRQTTKIGGI
jgi:hypothetical protein